MSLLALLAGGGTFVVVLAVAFLLRQLPSGRFCPECGVPTISLRSGFWIRLLLPRIHARWCSGCGWSGFRRSRPPRDPSQRPPAHESGFRWARPDPSEAPIFTWRSTKDEKEARPGHPSGFRWKDEPDPEAPKFFWGEEKDEEAGD